MLVLTFGQEMKNLHALNVIKTAYIHYAVTSVALWVEKVGRTESHNFPTDTPNF